MGVDKFNIILLAINIRHVVVAKKILMNVDDFAFQEAMAEFARDHRDSFTTFMAERELNEILGQFDKARMK